MIAGDLPPSSSVTGVRLAAAARITWWPTAVEPVNSRWSNGSAENACATSASPFTTVTSSGCEIFRHLLGEQRREARRVFAHLQHRAIAGDQRIDQRADGQIQRVIPRHDDADHAARLRPQLGACGQEQQVGQASPRLHPAPAVAECVTDRRQAGKDLQQVGFLCRALAEVGVDRRGERPALFAQHGFQRAQALQAHRPGGQRVERLRVTQALQGGNQFVASGHGLSGISHATRRQPCVVA